MSESWWGECDENPKLPSRFDVDRTLHGTLAFTLPGGWQALTLPTLLLEMRIF